MSIHRPVLLREVLSIFEPKKGERYIDATINGGGHAEAILERIGQKGKLIGIDWDGELINNLRQTTNDPRHKNLILVCDNYANIESIARKYNLDKIDGILFDLGFSSHQLEESGRGFSFLKKEPLDMRYNVHENKYSVSTIVNTWPREAIEDILRKFGEERFAGRIAAGIVRARAIRRISAADELADIVERSVPRVGRGRIHPATRTFQALRIAVNHELENLEQALKSSVELLRPQGKIIVISFHSLEDRIVKNFFREEQKEGVMTILTKKPIVASWEEKRINPRARSAKLRAAEIAVTGY